MVTLAVAVNGLVEDDICKGQMEGNFLRNPEDCSRYLSCAGDKIKETKACMDDLLWDTDKNDCRPPDAVTCDNVNYNSIWLSVYRNLNQIQLIFQSQCRNRLLRTTHAPLMQPKNTDAFRTRTIHANTFCANMELTRVTGEMYESMAKPFVINCKQATQIVRNVNRSND